MAVANTEENFAELFENSLSETNLQTGTIINGTVLEITKDHVIVDVNLKAEGYISKVQFQDEIDSIKIGDSIEVVLDALDDGWGEPKVSRDKVKRLKTWEELSQAFENSSNIMGIISGKVKGGFTVDIKSVRAFLPGSQVDIRPVRNSDDLEGQELEFKIIKLDQKRNNIVVSRRSVVESENSVEREALLSSLQEGQEVKGVVKNLTDYGAFVDLGGIDGLLHITDMAWKRVKHPSEVVQVGQELRVKILKFDRDKNRVSLGLKQLGDDPWVDISSRYPVGMRLKGFVTNITDYGCFVEIEEGVEGLVHVSEMDWTNKNIHPSKVVQLGVEAEVMVLDIDQDRRRISLGLKQCQDNPWDAFANLHNKGDKISGAIKSITDFGIFIGLDGSIDGLVHLSDISWQLPGEEAIRNYKKGQELEAMILGIDAERERISLGIKQLERDPFSNFIADNTKGTVVTGTVQEVDAKGAIIELEESVEGYLRATELARDKVEDATQHLKEGDSVKAKIIGVDKKNRMILLSVKAKDVQEEQEALRELSQNSDQDKSNPTLGDLLKEQMSGDK